MKTDQINHWGVHKTPVHSAERRVPTGEPKWDFFQVKGMLSGFLAQLKPL
jgi:hypothetical protein